MKNYHELPHNTGITEPSSKIEVQDCSAVCAPPLKLKKKIHDKHLIYEDGLTYTGNTVMIGTDHRPMGFGQLYKNNQLFYCGNWKNGVFDGWGKLYLPQT